MKSNKFRFFVLAATMTLTPVHAIDIVGSSTVYPFSTVAAERFSQITGNKAPKVEATGSGGGMKLFCSRVGDATPDITNASRRMKASEQKICDKNGVTDVIEVKIGYDGIVLAQSLQGMAMQLTRRDVFLALAREVPDGDGRLVKNPHKTWQDINSSLPSVDIRVYGPPPTSGTRDAFAELVLEEGCNSFAHLKSLAKDKHKAVCHAIREDGVYVESGENDNLIIQKLTASSTAVGVFGFSFLEENRDKVRGIDVEGVSPEFEAIADGSYPVSRPLYFYVKKAHYGKTAALEDFVNFFVEEDVMGADGFLVDRGLIPLPDAEYAKTAGAVANRENMERL